jgi:hypothetical protein
MPLLLLLRTPRATVVTPGLAHSLIYYSLERSLCFAVGEGCKVKVVVGELKQPKRISASVYLHY